MVDSILSVLKSRWTGPGDDRDSEMLRFSGSSSLPCLARLRRLKGLCRSRDGGGPGNRYGGREGPPGKEVKGFGGPVGGEG